MTAISDILQDSGIVKTLCFILKKDMYEQNSEDLLYLACVGMMV